MIDIKELDQVHESSAKLMVVALQRARECGELLLQQQAELRPNDFWPWVITNCNFSERTAKNYMAIASGKAGAIEPSDEKAIRNALRKYIAVSAKMEEPEPDRQHFTWFKDEKITRCYDAIREINTAVTLLSKDDIKEPGAAFQIMKQWETYLLKIIERIRWRVGS